jgi:transposase
MAPGEKDGLVLMTRTPTYNAEFKRETIQELLLGEKRASQICRDRGIDVTTLRRWRLEYEEKGADGWTPAGLGTASLEEKVASLERLIGQLTVENSILKKALQQAHSLSARATPSSGH